MDGGSRWIRLLWKNQQAGRVTTAGARARCRQRVQRRHTLRQSAGCVPLGIPSDGASNAGFPSSTTGSERLQIWAYGPNMNDINGPVNARLAPGQRARKPSEGFDQDKLEIPCG
jgi:hypothetical protein